MLDTPLFRALALVAASAVFGLLLQGLVLRRLERLAARTPNIVDDWIVQSLRRRALVWCLFVGVIVAVPWLEAPAKVSLWLERIARGALIVSVTWWGSQLAGYLLSVGVQDGPDGERTAPAAGVVIFLARAAVLAVGGVALLGTLDISVAPLLTTLGIGGLAVALGLQPTLANLFAGTQITLAGNVRVGDFIRLESGEEGYIDDIHWRSTRVRTLGNNFVLIPNSRLAQSVVTNYHRPGPELNVLIPLGVHYSSDLEAVERLTLGVASAVQQSSAHAVPEFHPMVRFTGFGDSSIEVTVTLRAPEFAHSIPLRHEFIKALLPVYRSSGIQIPYPIRTLEFSQQPGALMPARSDGKVS